MNDSLLSNRKLVVPLLATISAILSGLLITPSQEAVAGVEPGAGFAFNILYGPGFWFGLAIVIVLRLYSKVAWARLGTWLVMSIIIWRVALEIAISSGSESPLSLVLPGAIGAGLLAFGHGLLVTRVDGRQIGMITGIGAAAGVAMYITLKIATGGGEAVTVLLFLLWQIPVAIAFDKWMQAFSWKADLAAPDQVAASDVSHESASSSDPFEVTPPEDL